MAIILLVSAYMCADIVSILCDKKEENKLQHQLVSLQHRQSLLNIRAIWVYPMLLNLLL